jgi:hypothetical protein
MVLDISLDTFVLGQGWEALSIHNTRRDNVVGFDHDAAIRGILPIVSVIAAVNHTYRISVLIVVHGGIYHDTTMHSLFSEFQLRDSGINLTQFVTNMEGHRKW